MVSPYKIALCFFSFLIWQIAFTYFLIECRNTILFPTSNFIEKIINKFDNIIIIIVVFIVLGFELVPSAWAGLSTTVVATSYPLKS